jgi:integrase
MAAAGGVCRHLDLGRRHVAPWTPARPEQPCEAAPVQEPKPLAQVIAATKTGDLHFLVTEYGKPFSTTGLGQKIRTWCDEAGVPGTAHGLRKAGATRAAENGATEYQLMAIFGWLDPEMAATYVKAANRKRLADAGMPLLSKQSVDEKLPPSPSPAIPVGELERRSQ